MSEETRNKLAIVGIIVFVVLFAIVMFNIFFHKDKDETEGKVIIDTIIKESPTVDYSNDPVDTDVDFEITERVANNIVSVTKDGLTFTFGNSDSDISNGVVIDPKIDGSNSKYFVYYTDISGNSSYTGDRAVLGTEQFKNYQFIKMLNPSPDGLNASYINSSNPGIVWYPENMNKAEGSAFIMFVNYDTCRVEAQFEIYFGAIEDGSIGITEVKDVEFIDDTRKFEVSNFVKEMQPYTYGIVEDIVLSKTQVLPYNYCTAPDYYSRIVRGKFSSDNYPLNVATVYFKDVTKMFTQVYYNSEWEFVGYCEFNKVREAEALEIYDFSD